MKYALRCRQDSDVWFAEVGYTVDRSERYLFNTALEAKHEREDRSRGKQEYAIVRVKPPADRFTRALKWIEKYRDDCLQDWENEDDDLSERLDAQICAQVLSTVLDLLPDEVPE